MDDNVDGMDADRICPRRPITSRCQCGSLEHFPEKWSPVFRKKMRPLNRTRVLSGSSGPESTLTTRSWRKSYRSGRRGSPDNDRKIRRHHRSETGQLRTTVHRLLVRPSCRNARPLAIAEAASEAPTAPPTHSEEGSGGSPVR